MFSIKIIFIGVPDYKTQISIKMIKMSLINGAIGFSICYLFNLKKKMI